MYKYSLIVMFMGLLLCSSCNQEETTLSGMNPERFSASVEGKPVRLYTLKNKNDLEATITNFGGRIVSLWVPDRNGTFADIVLGHDSIQDYLNIEGNFGAIIGRYGNRIANANFVLDGKEYLLPINNGTHCLHGGPEGFDRKVWEVVADCDSSLLLKYISVDGEAGFSGNLSVEVRYTLRSDNALEITYNAVTDAPTVVNLTNHSYFNLSGNPEYDILGHILKINADTYLPVDSTLIPLGTIASVDNTVFDFTTPKAIGSRINEPDEQLIYAHGYDHNYILNTKGDINTVACKVVEPESGRTMEVFTNEPGVQFYSCSHLDGSISGKKGIKYGRSSALCLETQHYPDTPHHPEWPTVVLRPGEKYHSVCIYKFGVE